MSGDVQPRKRKDKRRKRDGLDRKSEGELSFSRQASFQDDDESSHGVHITKMGSDDVHLHVHQEHGTGGNWCAKIIFFSLMAVLLGLVGLIILENRGLADLDTPLSESRFSNYFDGWVEEARDEHDEHDAVQASIEDHEDHDEPFEEEDEEEENQSEVDEDHDADDEHDDEEDDEHDADEDEADQADDDDDEDGTAEVELTQEEQDDDEQQEDDQLDDNDDDDEDEQDDNVTAEQTVENDDDDNDDNDDDDVANDDDDDDDDANEHVEAQPNDDDDEADNNGGEIDDNDDENDDDADDVQSAQNQRNVADDNGFDEDDDDDDDDDEDVFDSLDDIVDNDAAEKFLLQEKAARQAAQNKHTSVENNDDDNDEDADNNDQQQQQAEQEKSTSWAASLAVKIGVGVALALVARLVLIRKNPNTIEEPSAEVLMKRRLTIASAEEHIPTDDEEEAPPLEDDYSEEEVEIEEEIEYELEDEEELDIIEHDADDDGDHHLAISGHYIPETFEQLNAMYRGKDQQTDAKSQPTTEPQQKSAAVFNAPLPPPLIEAKIVHKPPTNEVAAKRDTSQPWEQHSDAVDNIETEYYGEEKAAVGDDDDDDDVDVDDDESYDLDDLDDNEGDISDVDDTELMNRLEAKYGRLPAKEYESDEDPDDPTWTQIKVKKPTGAGPQAHDDDGDDNDDDDDDAGLDQFEQELRQANEAMLRKNYALAVQSYVDLTQKYANRPQVFLAQARALDRIADIQHNNRILSDALLAYKRYLAFGDVLDGTHDLEFVAAAERCIERMRFMGYHLQAVPIHEQLIERYSDVPKYRNQLSLTYLMMNRLADVKSVAAKTLSRWPTDGLAQLHYGFALKQLDNAYEEAARYMRHGLLSSAEGTQEAFFYFTLGETLQRLGLPDEALQIYARAVKMKFFPSVYQRSLYNVPNLRANPYWRASDTGYAAEFAKFQANWLAIRDEALALLNQRGTFEQESENLRETGDWQQFELYARGERRHRNCQKAPITCSLLAQFPAAIDCKRGQVKFSVMQAGTHVWPHCGPTNCRLRAHLGLVVPEGAHLRVAREQRTWREGEFLIFDDSFEHEVWHNGTSRRIVLIVDVWHPDLSAAQRRTLTPI